MCAERGTSELGGKRHVVGRAMLLLLLLLLLEVGAVDNVEGVGSRRCAVEVSQPIYVY